MRLLILTLLLVSTCIHAGTQPKFSIIPTTPVTNIPTNVAQYRVTNNTKITRTLRMVDIVGVTQILGGANGCGTTFTLARGQSCLLTLKVTSHSLSSTPVEVCKTNYNNSQPDPFECSQTSKANNISTTFPAASLKARLVVTPKILVLTADGAAGTITVKNVSPLITAVNVQANISNTALNGNVTESSVGCTSVAPGATCDLEFTPGSEGVSLTAFSIQSENSNPAPASIQILSSGTSQISVSGGPLVLEVGTSGTLTVTNNSAVAASSVAADLTPDQQTALSQNSSGCSSLAAYGNCSLQFTGTGELPSEVMFISGANTTLTASGVAVNASTQAQLQISSGSPLVLKADGSTKGTMTITNTSATLTASDVQANFINTDLNGKVTATTCGDIAPSASCTMTFTPGIFTAVPTDFIISGSNTSAVTGNIAINSYYAYITNQGPIGENQSTVVICALNQSTGSLSSSCSSSSAIPSLFRLAGSAFNSAADHAYFISSVPPTVTDCKVNSTSGALSSCKNTTLININSLNGNGIAYNPHFNTVYATISGSSASAANSYVYQCTLNTDNTINSCSDTGAYNLTYPTGISFNPAGTISYIANFSSSNAIVNCDVDQSTGGLSSSCNQNSVGSNNIGIAVNPTNTFVYVSQELNNRISQCTIDQSNNGAISSCSNVSASTTLAQGISLNSATNFLYVSNYSGSAVQQCTVASDGSVSGCSTNSGAYGLENTQSVALYPTPPQ